MVEYSDSDFSDQDDQHVDVPEGSQQGGGTSRQPGTPQIANGVLSFEDLDFMNVADFQVQTGIVLDLDPTSSDDEVEYDDLIAPRVSAALGAVEENVNDIYPFAWALDGRRVGDGSASHSRRDDSLTSPFEYQSHQPEVTVPLCNIPSIRFGSGFLARTFARLVKDLVDVACKISSDKSSSNSSSSSSSSSSGSTQPPTLSLPPDVCSQLVHSTVLTLEQSWQWVAAVLDVAEGQLQRGQQFDSQRHVVSLRSMRGLSASGVQSGRSLNSFTGSTPGEYITYLLRSHTHEDAHCLPVIDLYGYEHVVYVLDGLIYTLANWPQGALTSVQSDPSKMTSSSQPPPTNQTELPAGASTTDPPMEMGAESETQTKSLSTIVSSSQKQALSTAKFFQRTESVILSDSADEDSDFRRSNEQFIGGSERTSTAEGQGPSFLANWWEDGGQAAKFSCPTNRSYPLAHNPHLLRPFAKKQQLFSSGGGVLGVGGEGVSGEGGGGGCRRASQGLQGRLPVSYEQAAKNLDGAPITVSWSVEQVLRRWHSAIGIFAHIFLAEGPGNERANFLNARAGFASRMARFRHQVTQLHDASQITRDWASTVSSTFSVRVRREHLVQDALDTLQQMGRFHYSQIRVRFEGEDGSGPGVNRGFFASLANELKTADLSKQPMNKLGLLFHEPGKQPEQSALFSPCPFIPCASTSFAKNPANRSQRKKVFRSIGRFFGLCLWFRYTVPFLVCRHVAKFILGRELAWHDLAFYNAELYEGLRRMMLDAEEGKMTAEEFMATYCCYFEAPLSRRGMEPLLVELIQDGSKIPVTQERVQEYVRLYAMFMMVDCVKEELQAMKDGLTDVIPQELLSGLTAEDFQLLLSGGSADISLSKLKSVIRFNHSHGSSASTCDRFEKMFWRVVSHMGNTQRQQLLYFATGSAALPVSTDTTDRSPVAITIDVIGSSNTESLPVASTCSQRMSIPLYPSYHLLKKKLLQAIQCQAYGLG